MMRRQHRKLTYNTLIASITTYWRPLPRPRLPLTGRRARCYPRPKLASGFAAQPLSVLNEADRWSRWARLNAVMPCSKPSLTCASWGTTHPGVHRASAGPCREHYVELE